jgi:hypothetical protein
MACKNLGAVEAVLESKCRRCEAGGGEMVVAEGRIG